MLQMVMCARSKNKAVNGGVVSRRRTTKDVHTPIPESIILHSKKDFADVVKLRIWR